MLSIELCQQILNKNSDNKFYTKEEAKKIRDYLYTIAEVDIMNFKQKGDDKERNHLSENID
jgi:hypothetical protein